MRRFLILALALFVSTALGASLAACGTHPLPPSATATLTATKTPTSTPTATAPPTETPTPKPTEIAIPAELAAQAQTMGESYGWDNGRLNYTDAKTGDEKPVFEWNGAQASIRLDTGETINIDPKLLQAIPITGGTPILTIANAENPAETAYFYLPKTGEWTTQLQVYTDPYILNHRETMEQTVTLEDFFSGRAAASQHLAYLRGEIKNFPEGTPSAGGPVKLSGDGSELAYYYYAPDRISARPKDQRPHFSNYDIIPNLIKDGEDVVIGMYAVPTGNGGVRFLPYWCGSRIHNADMTVGVTALKRGQMAHC